MNKESYLNYIMLTKPKEDWSSLVFAYIMDNNINNWRKGFDFIIGHVDTSHDNNESALFHHVYWLVVNDRVPTEWGMEVIENNPHNQHAKYAASWLVSENKVPLDWYKKIWNDGIEHLT